MNYGKKPKLTALLALLIFIISSAGAQSFVTGSITNGYAEKVSGTDFRYHSPVPDVKESLIVRASDGNSSMEWKTAPLLLKPGEKKATIAWLAGIGSSPGLASFDLAVNGQKKFTFPADGRDEWRLTANDGAVLSFTKNMIDQFGDRFGFMLLTIPSNLIKAGEPVILKVTGGNYGRTSWYMTFKFPLREGLSLKALPALFESNGRQYQLGVAGILHFGQPEMARIFIGKKLVKETKVSFGYNYVKLGLPCAKETISVKYGLELGQIRQTGMLTLSPVRHWSVNFVQHTHTDIGYTRPQTDIMAEHLRFIDYALDYCDQTDKYPDAARFRWTCEASWPVDEYLKCRPREQIDRLKKRVAQGRIEITGMYLNFDELPDEQILAASLQPIRRFRQNDIAVKTAMQNDVNGIGWCLNDYFTDLGIRYLNMGTHGHRALIAFDKPTLFRWESPSGNSILAYRGEHYMTGNTVFKIHAGDIAAFEDELLTYLAGLQTKGYRYDVISIQHSGYLTDNSPPSVLACEMIRSWNEKYTWPRLKTSSATAFFEEMESRYGNTFPVIRGAWPDWWTDGFGASAREVAAVRTAGADLVSNSAGLTMAALLGAKLPERITDRIDLANSALLFYTEHTVGYHASVSEPFGQNTMEQRAIKESYAWEAGRRTGMLGEETMGMLQSFIPKTAGPALAVFNTLNFRRSGLFTMYADHQIIPRYSSFRLIARDGSEAKAQPLENFTDGTTWAVWVDTVPAFGFRQYRIEVGENRAVESGPVENAKINATENQWYKLTVDTVRAAISNLYDKSAGREITDQLAEYKLGEFVYETLGNRSQMESFRLDNFKREPLEKVRFDGYHKGTIWNSFLFRGNTRAAENEDGFRLEIRIYNTAKQIDLVYYIEKKMVTGPEGIYIAFPFSLDNGQWAFDVPGGEVRAGIDQIPGSANDWNTVQTYARLFNGSGQVILSSKEIPLMQFGGINTGRYKAGAVPASTHVYGWPMNNYWTTNFNAEQHGGHSWTYTLTGSADHSQHEASHWGQQMRIPLLSRILPGGGQAALSGDISLIGGWPANTLLISARPMEDGRSAVMHLRETAGSTARLSLKNNLTGRMLQCIPVDVTGNALPNGTLEIKPLESKFFRIIL